MFSKNKEGIFHGRDLVFGRQKKLLPPPSQSNFQFSSQFSINEYVDLTQIAGPSRPNEFQDDDFSQNDHDGKLNLDESVESKQSQELEEDTITISSEEIVEEKLIEPGNRKAPFVWKTFDDFKIDNKREIENISSKEKSNLVQNGTHNRPNFPIQHGNGVLNLVPVTTIPPKYRDVFGYFPYFNIVQSKVFKDVFFSDKPLVVCAPTGSGKTVIFELAIIRFLHELDQKPNQNPFKIIYMAPIKALCSERQADWSNKFGPYGLQCVELTGDSDFNDYLDLKSAAIILTTPEKWDSITRRWRDNVTFVANVVLFLVDEIHSLNDDVRGATMEVVITRMKTVHSNLTRNKSKALENSAAVRFVGVSATIPNAEDIASWLSCSSLPGVSHKLDESVRPVTLKRVVLGFEKRSTDTDFKFELFLSYKLQNVIEKYSNYKPTIVFCSTRKSVVQSASILAKKTSYVANALHKQKLAQVANILRDNKLRETVLCGIGFHHAGLDFNDRKKIEEMFVHGELLVLISTSTLAMGVNFPAHLVIIKSTSQYVAGAYREYSETQILQMIGRAGRPQFDSTATAVIMTTTTNKSKYELLVNGTQLVESSLHKNLIEHLNAEIVLQTITDLEVALEWIRATFLYIRVMKNPKYYGIQEGLAKKQIEQKLSDICGKALRALSSIELIRMDENLFDLKALAPGRLMARYCVTFDSMKKFYEIGSSSSLGELLTTVTSCSEFQDVQLRINERKVLNTLNKDKHKATIRFPMQGRIKSPDMKVNCLIQTAFGCLPLQEFSLNQDTTRILRVGQRISKCLSEYIQMSPKGYKTLLNAILLAKCFRAKIWENSKHVSKQMDKIGMALSNLLVQAGMTSFEKIMNANPHEIEMFVNRHPPFGTHLKHAVEHLPNYTVNVEQGAKCSARVADLCVTIAMVNYQVIRENSTTPSTHSCVLVIGDSDNNVVMRNRIMDTVLLRNGQWVKKIEVQRATTGDELVIHLLSEIYVGLDVNSKFIPFYIGARSETIPKAQVSASSTNKSASKSKLNSQNSPQQQSDSKSCNHRCLDKIKCRHSCCKIGTKEKPSPSQTQMSCYLVTNYKESIKENNIVLPNVKTLENIPQTDRLENLKKTFEFTGRYKRNLEEDTPETFQKRTCQKYSKFEYPNFDLENDFDKDEKLLTKEVMDCMNDDDFFKEDFGDMTVEDFQLRSEDDFPDIEINENPHKITLENDYICEGMKLSATASKHSNEDQILNSYDPDKTYKEVFEEFDVIFGHVFD